MEQPASYKRWPALAAAVIMQTCLGGIYAWSVFVPPLSAAFGYTAGQTQLVFGLAIACFTITMVLAGRLLLRWGPRRTALLGSLLFACGHLLAAMSQGHYLLLLGGIGLLGGASLGFGYVAALAIGIQWFPRHKGLVTGVAVAGFGAGAIVLSTFTSFCLHRGWPVLDIIRAIGWSYGVLTALSALLLFTPPPAIDHRPHSATSASLLGDRVFRALVGGMFCGTFAGLLVIGNLKPIGLNGGLTATTAAMAISFFALGNAVGRISWGWISDRVGYVAIPFSLVFLCGTLGLLLGARFIALTFWTVAFLMGFGFGSCFVLYAAQTASRYGVSEVAKIYPLVFLAYGAAGLAGPPLGGHLFDLTRNYTWSILAGMVMLLLGAVWTWRVRHAARTD
ncbi:MAG: hypothetical protein A2X46_14305 [Lentisphaerae bacterium GWF2_57_35]|nr:MAG: hypothetical protein A2X46_14305 [Lentisphaerae bacterium GWF2_57_35]